MTQTPDEGKWIEMELDELFEMFQDVIESSSLTAEYDFNLKPIAFYKNKFPGLPEEAYEILQEEDKKTETTVPL